jgi:hypothetical protein
MMNTLCCAFLIAKCGFKGCTQFVCLFVHGRRRGLDDLCSSAPIWANRLIGSFSHGVSFWAGRISGWATAPPAPPLHPPMHKILEVYKHDMHFSRESVPATLYYLIRCLTAKGDVLHLSYSSIYMYHAKSLKVFSKIEILLGL